MINIVKKFINNTNKEREYMILLTLPQVMERLEVLKKAKIESQKKAKDAQVQTIVDLVKRSSKAMSDSEKFFTDSCDNICATMQSLKSKPKTNRAKSPIEQLLKNHETNAKKKSTMVDLMKRNTEVGEKMFTTLTDIQKSLYETIDEQVNRIKDVYINNKPKQQLFNLDACSFGIKTEGTGDALEVMVRVYKPDGSTLGYLNLDGVPSELVIFQSLADPDLYLIGDCLTIEETPAGFEPYEYPTQTLLCKLLFFKNYMCELFDDITNSRMFIVGVDPNDKMCMLVSNTINGQGDKVDARRILTAYRLIGDNVLVSRSSTDMAVALYGFDAVATLLEQLQQTDHPL